MAALGRWGFFMRAGLLAACLLLVLAVLAPVGFQLSGPAGVFAAGLSALLCLAGGVLSLVVCPFFRGPYGALYGMLVGMALRTGLPLVVGVAIHLTRPALASAGLIYFLLACYLASLAVETLLAVAEAQRQAPGTESR